MGHKREWDESRSPQWRYLLSKDSQEKRNKQKKLEQAESNLKRGVSKRKRIKQEARKEKRLNKQGKEIIYTATPGGNHDRYLNKEFIETRKTPQ